MSDVLVDTKYQLVPKSVWLIISNCHEDKKLRISLEVNGNVVEEYLAIKPTHAEIEEGVILRHHNLTWLLK